MISRSYLLMQKREEGMVRNLTSNIGGEVDELIDRVNAILHKKREELRIKVEETVDSQFIPIDKDRNMKIFDYKDMIKLAELNNYTLDRVCGDHMIYKNIESFKIVVIPAHALGFGLMKKIQKQITQRM